MSQPSFQTLLEILMESLSGSSALPLIDFQGLFPHKDSLNQIYLDPSEDYLPELAGPYQIVDLYCQVPSCNCHKVSLMFLDRHQETWATISYGWKSKGFYRKWGLDKDTTLSLTRGFLDPWAQQSEHAPYFLKAFLRSLKKDTKFIARLKSRYAFLKKALGEDPSLIKYYPAEKELPENVIPFDHHKHG